MICFVDYSITCGYFTCDYFVYAFFYQIECDGITMIHLTQNPFQIIWSDV